MHASNNPKNDKRSPFHKDVAPGKNDPKNNKSTPTFILTLAQAAWNPNPSNIYAATYGCNVC